MNIGIDFNTKTTKAAFSIDGSNIDDCKIFETKNILVISNGNIVAGDDGFNKFLTERDSAIYDLDQIIEWNGLIVNKQQISAEKCLSTIFANLLNKIKTHTQNSEIGFICISIPYDKYYYWHDLMKKVFSLIGIQKVRIISQPAAFFAQPNINHLHGTLNQQIHNQAVNKHAERPWFKKLLSRRPKYHGENGSSGYLFVSVSQDNTNVSLVNYGDSVLEVVSTQYTNGITRRKIEQLVLDHFILEISKDSRNFSVKDQKTLLRISEIVNEFLKTPLARDTFELNLPYTLCEDGTYRTLDTKIDLDLLRSFLAPMFKNLVESIKELAIKTQEAQPNERYRVKIGSVIVVGDLFIQRRYRRPGRQVASV